MSRYFFHVRNDQYVRTDYIGVELSDFSAALAYALRSARDVLSDEPVDGAIAIDGYIEVEDQLGARVHSLFLSDASERWCPLRMPVLPPELGENEPGMAAKTSSANQRRPAL